MKKFLLETEDDYKESLVNEALDEYCGPSFITTELTPELELQQALETVKKAGYSTSKKIESPVVKTGVLMSPDEIIDGTIEIVYLDRYGNSVHLHKDDKRIGKREKADFFEFPYSCYKNIRQEIDYSKIPIGNLIRCISNNDEWTGYLKSYDGKNNSLIISFVSPFAGGNTRHIDLNIYKIEGL